MFKMALFCAVIVQSLSDNTPGDGNTVAISNRKSAPVKHICAGSATSVVGWKYSTFESPWTITGPVIMSTYLAMRMYKFPVRHLNNMRMDLRHVQVLTMTIL